MTLREKLEAIRRAVRGRYLRIVARIAGFETLTTEERTQLSEIADQSLDPGAKSVVEEVVKFGRIVSRDASMMDSSYDEFIAADDLEADDDTVEIAQEALAQSTRKLSAEVETRISREIANAARQGASVANTAAKVAKIAGSYDRDWRMIVASEMHSAREKAYAEESKRKYGDDVDVFKKPLAGACPSCLELHLGPDGHPRIFKLSDLEANGYDNAGRKRAEWVPVIGITHPWCQCALVSLPAGWGFDEEGHITPNGKFGMRTQDIERSLKWERNLRRLQKGGEGHDKPVVYEVNYHGLKICIENPPGSVRHWKSAPLGTEGNTKMLYAYGYIKDTQGADKGSYDVFLGPDPNSMYVWIIHQSLPQAETLWDEDKSLVGWSNVDEAIRAYLYHFDSHDFITPGNVSMMSLAEFKDKVAQTVQGKGGLVHDGMVKTLNQASGSYDSPLGNRAVDTGVSGYAIAWKQPLPPNMFERDPSDYRGAIEELARREPNEPKLLIHHSVYNVRDLNLTPVMPIEEPFDRTEFDDPEHGEGLKEYIQWRLDQRFDLGETVLHQQPGDPKDEERYFILDAPRTKNTDESGPKIP